MNDILEQAFSRELDYALEGYKENESYKEINELDDDTRKAIVEELINDSWLWEKINNAIENNLNDYGVVKGVNF